MVPQNGGRRSKVADATLRNIASRIPFFDATSRIEMKHLVRDRSKLIPSEDTFRQIEITNPPSSRSDEIVKPAKNNTSRVTYLRIRNRGSNIPCPGLPGTNERKRLLLTGEIATARACVRARSFRTVRGEEEEEEERQAACRGRKRREGRAAIERYRKLVLERETTPPRTYVYHVDRNTCEQRCGFHGEEEEEKKGGPTESLVRATRFCRTATTPAFSADLDPPKIGFLGNRSTMRRL